LRTKSFAELSKDELADLAELMKRLQVNVPSRRTRRREPSRKGSPDLRRTLRRSFRTGGEPVEGAWLSAADAKEALRRAAAEVVDWNGGTRIGDAVRALMRTNVVRGAVVVICSDGLDVGEPELLSAEMARLSRLAHRVVWLNPLKEDPAYEPLARGMKAALPHIDVFLSGHNLASLEAIGEAL